MRTTYFEVSHRKSLEGEVVEAPVLGFSCRCETFQCIQQCSKGSWKEIQSDLERFWISLELEEYKTEKSCAMCPEEFHSGEYWELSRATIPYSNRREVNKKRIACHELCGIRIELLMDLAGKSCLPEF
ncbi:hypothetical protein TNCT_415761 [Trichonephila clavata]|uniref:Uncharacterized protein n=1 Tax=Trichonephila clavata TaxID=2740835 RepID=A0A8X6FE75_TRICU|nr:hypothetical protein TNCT_415761 [Trichonephila clavata]